MHDIKDQLSFVYSVNMTQVIGESTMAFQRKPNVQILFCTFAVYGFWPTF